MKYCIKQLNIKHLAKMKYVIILFLIFTQNSNSQRLSIETEFTENGTILSKGGLDGDDLANFSKGDKCLVIDYSGYNYYKVKTEKATGYVRSDFLYVTYEMKEFAKKIEDERTIRRKKETEEKLLNEQKEKENLKLEMRKSFEESKAKMELITKRNDSLKEVNTKKTCHYLRNEIDKYDKVKVVETDYYSVYSDYELGVKLKKFGGRKYVYFSLNQDIGCASSYSSSRSSVKVYLENDDMLTFYHTGDINCREFTLIGKLSESEIVRLKKSKIESIRLQGTEYFTDIDKIDYKEFFIDKVGCIE